MNKFKKYIPFFALSLAGIFLLLAQSASWTLNILYDRQAFVSISTSVIQKEKNRLAIAERIIEGALSDKPLVNRLVGKQASSLVAGLLGTDLAQRSIQTIADKSYGFVTSPNPQPITIDLTSIKRPIAGLVSLAENNGTDISFDLQTVPDQIVLVETENIPEFHRYGVTLLWIAPLLWMASIVIFGTYLYRGRRVFAKRFYIVASVIAITALIGLLSGPVLPPPVAALVPNVSSRIVVEDLLTSFLAPFMKQMMITLLLTAVVVVLFATRDRISALFYGLYKKTETKKPATKTKK
jgi:hypothetical protein